VKRLVVLASLALAFVSVAACSSPTGGSGIPTFTTTGGNGAAGGSSSAAGSVTTSGSGGSSGSGGGSLANADPCSLLSSSDAATAGLSAPGTKDQVGAEPSCDYVGSNGTLIVGILTSGGISVFGKGTPVSIGSHQGMQDDQGDTGCEVAIGVTDSSRVDITATENTGSACPQALQVAKLIEPHLPSS
jgi:hypothetical protein